MEDPTENRLTRLEELSANQAQEIEKLSDLVRQQWDEIARLTKALRLFKDKLVEIEETLPDKPASHEIPPHY